MDRLDRRAFVWQSWGAALVIGGAYFVFLVGTAPLYVGNVAWLRNVGDPTQAFLGWSFLRLDPVWHFPPTHTAWLGWPLGTSVSFTDSIPLVAIVARWLSPILPTEFQYFGMWTLANFVLSSYFAIRICTLITGRLNAAALVASTLLLIAPCMTDRVLYHIALSSHFLILLSLWLYLMPCPKVSWWRLTLPQAGVLALSASIHPYLLVVTGALSVAFFGRCWAERRISFWAASLSVGAVISTAMGLLIVFGYFVGGDVANYAGYGYRHYSFNLLSPINSMGMSAFIPPIAVADVRQREGFNYLGLGILFLLALNLRSIVGGLPKMFISKHWPLIAICTILLLLSASTLITLGPYTIVDAALPNPVTNLLAAFRASGRFFWPVGYLIMVGAIFLSWRNYGARLGTALLAIALVLQFADEAPLRDAVRARMENSRSSPLLANNWSQLNQSVKRLIVLPAWQCGSPLTPGGSDGYAIFGSLAARQGLETNNVYLARMGPEANYTYCHAMPNGFRHGQVEQNTAYVVSDDLLTQLRARGGSSLKCGRVDGFNLCLPNRRSEFGSPRWVKNHPILSATGKLRAVRELHKNPRILPTILRRAIARVHNRSDWNSFRDTGPI